MNDIGKGLVKVATAVAAGYGSYRLGYWIHKKYHEKRRKDIQKALVMNACEADCGIISVEEFNRRADELIEQLTRHI